jgi:hypothetical protein
MKKPKFLSEFEPTAARGKWFKVKDGNHSSTDAPNKEFYEMKTFTALMNNATKVVQ